MKLLLGAHDQVEQMQARLQLGGHSGRGDEPAFAVAMTGQPPQIGAVINIQRGFGTVFARQRQRFQYRRFGVAMAQMGAGGGDTARLGDEGGVDVIFAQRHVSAVFPVKDQRKLMLIANAQDHQRRQPRRISGKAAHIDAFAHQLFADEAAHMLIANPADQRRAQPQPRGSGSDIGGGATDVFLERRHILQPPADLRAIKVNR